VRMPEPENLKVEDLSKSGQTGTSLSVGYWSRDALQRDTVYSRCSPRAREFPRSVNFSVGRTVAELRFVKLAKFSDFGLCQRYMRSTECPSSFILLSFDEYI